MRRVLCGFLALVLSSSSSVGCSLAASAVIDDEPQQVEQVQEWFCEEHQQPLIPEDDLPEGYIQFCPDCAAENSIMVLAEGDLQTGAIPVSSVSWAIPGDNLWHAAAAVLGPGGVVSYYIDNDWSSTSKSVDVRIVFRNDVSFSPPAGSSSVYPYFNLNVGIYNEEYLRTWYFQSTSGTPMGQYVYVLCSLDGSTYRSLGDFSSTTTPTSSNLSTYRLSGRYSTDPVSPQNQVFYNFKFGNDFVIPRGCAFYVSDFGLSFQGADDVQPGQPGTLPDDSISQSWLGGLFDTIFGGIQEIVSGIENLPQSIASGLQSLFDGVTSAVNSVGSAITGAVDSASSAITSGLTALGNFLIEGLKTLFIPSDDYFSTVANDLMSWLEDHLGLLVYPFTLVTDLASRIAAISDTEPTLTFPELSFDMDGEEYTLIEETQVNLFDQLGADGSESRTTFETLHGYYLTLADAAIAGALALLAWRKFDQITGGAST